MEGQRDPIEEGATDSADLYDIATWEPRSWLDGISVSIYHAVVWVSRAVVVVLALAILVVQFALSGLAAVSDPVIGAFVLLSVVPAFGLAAYIWYADVTTSEPLSLLVATFLLGVLFAGFAAIINTAAGAVTLVPVVGMALFFYVVVAPVEETVKWLAVRLWAFRSEHFNAVIDGAVYGAMAGLGFATIENAIYITQGIGEVSTIGSRQIASARQTAAVRLLAGPGHVIYSAFAGYYLGLAKFNRENAGPIVVKGLLIAAFIHATYNTAVTYLTAAFELLGVVVSPGLAFIGFVVVYDGVFGYLLYRKISRYRAAYRQVDMGTDVTFERPADDTVTEPSDESATVEKADDERRPGERADDEHPDLDDGQGTAGRESE